MTASPSTKSFVILAFAAVYLIWGSTYFAIRVVVESLPPLLAAGIRFLVAGSSLLVWMACRRSPLPNAREWKSALISGALLTLGGNGLVMIAEQSTSSGLTSLIIALTPVWFALLDWLRPGGARPRAKTLAGILIGFTGVVFLLADRQADANGGRTEWGVLLLIAAGLLWAAGSLYTKHAAPARSVWMQSAAQMLCGGAGLVLVGFLAGEGRPAHWQSATLRSALALLYLIVFGSWIGYSAYVWLLHHSTPSRVSTYAYVNPVIAVFLGWAFLGETVTAGMLAGAAVILLGVVIITLPETAFRVRMPGSGSTRITPQPTRVGK